MVARAEAGIAHFRRPRGQARQQSATRGSGQRALMRHPDGRKGWTTADFSLASELAPAEAGAGRCATTTSTPSSSPSATRRARSRRRPPPATRRSWTSPATTVDALIEEFPFYFTAEFPGGHVPRQRRADPRPSASAPLSWTSAAVSDEAVYTLVKSVFDNFDSFIALQPGARQPRPGDDDLGRPLPLPLHEGRRALLPRARLDAVTRPLPGVSRRRPGDAWRSPRSAGGAPSRFRAMRPPGVRRGRE